MSARDQDKQATRRSYRRDVIIEGLASMGLSRDKTATLGGRVNPRLLEMAREQAGGVNDSQLIEIALGYLVMEDGFSEAFRSARGTVDPALDLDI